MWFVHRELKEKTKLKKSATSERQYPDGRYNLGRV